MHHALLLLGSFEWALSELPPHLQHEDTDVQHLTGGRMGIDDARALTSAAYQKPLSAPYRYFILGFREYTIEAQNALLKLLEEPPETAQFYIVIENHAKLLPTLLSRLVVEASESSVNEASSVHADARTFMEASYTERLAIILDRTTRKDDVWAERIMDALEVYAEKESHIELMRILTDVRPVFSLPGASKKMILEHLALTLPFPV